VTLTKREYSKPTKFKPCCKGSCHSGLERVIVDGASVAQPCRCLVDSDIELPMQFNTEVCRWANA
jgi:hypothetical protein